MSTEVFSINFVRSEFIPARLRRTAIYGVLGYLGINLLFLAFLLTSALFSALQSQFIQFHLQQKIHGAVQLDVLRQEMTGLHEHASQDLNQLRAIASLRKERIYFAPYLAALAETLPARTWIQSLSAEPHHRTLEIQAVYLIDPQKPYELPAKAWIEALKSDPRFKEGLKRLELGASSRTTQGKAKLFSFELLVEWEKGKA